MSCDSALYVHVPFCVSKCAYCDFYSEPISAASNCEMQYASMLARELEGLPKAFDPVTCYIGGGTPTALSAPVLKVVLESVLARAPHAVEITCEANPGTLTAEKTRALCVAGVNRVSLGAQSFSDHVLKFLGRIHQAEDVRAACRMLRDHDISNFSLDLMYGLPPSISQGPADDLAQLLALSPDHISCYALNYEPGTPMFRDLEAGRFEPLDDDRCRAQYDEIRTVLKEAGFLHYELSNFARPGRECRHNIVYWAGGDYLGAGPAAHSFWQGRRYGNVRDLAAWSERVGRRGWNPEAEELLDAHAAAREQVVMGLRMLEGISLSALHRETGFTLAGLYPDGEVDRLLELGMLTQEPDRLLLTEEALFISNAVFSELI